MTTKGRLRVIWVKLVYANYASVLLLGSKLNQSYNFEGKF